MSYVVLARKYRPMSFDDLVGQDHVARTLSNAIGAGRVAHAFLFTGVRGVGKTTSARILAKALNCMGTAAAVPGTDPGPTASPCLTCPACQEITSGTDVDVQEIDGASYNGVDEVRRLQDSLPYRPARDRFKIVIVDEVHMLSSSAWNAFLKTLEEPPPHVKFIFATTEVHKVPVTILSRVQRFDFKLIPARLIAERLRSVLDREGIRADDAALGVIAREAAGSMRDAMSLLDQVIAWGGEDLAGEDVARVLGVASRRALQDLAEALLAGDAERCLRVTQSLAEQGQDLGHVARDLLALLRDLVVARVCASPTELIDLPNEERADVVGLAASADTDDLVRLHQGFSHGFDEVLRSGQPRGALEMLLVRLARRPPLLPLDDLLQRLGALERRLGGGRGDPRPGEPPREPPAGAGRASPRTPDARTGPAAATATGRTQPQTPASTGRGERPGVAQTSPEGVAAEAPRGAGSSAPRSPETAPPLPSPERAESPGPRLPLPDAVPMEAPRSPGSGAESSPAQESAPAPTSRAPTDGSADGGAARRSGDAASDGAPGANAQVPDVWRRILARVSARSAEIGAFLGHAVPLRVSAEAIEVAFEVGSVFAERATSPDAIALLERAAAAELGTTPRVTIERDSARTQGQPTVATVLVAERDAARERAVTTALEHPAVRDAIAVLGARVRDVHLPDP